MNNYMLMSQWSLSVVFMTIPNGQSTFSFSTRSGHWTQASLCALQADTPSIFTWFFGHFCPSTKICGEKTERVIPLWFRTLWFWDVKSYIFPWAWVSKWVSKQVNEHSGVRKPSKQCGAGEWMSSVSSVLDSGQARERRL